MHQLHLNLKKKWTNTYTIKSDLSEVKELANQFNGFCAINRLNKKVSGLLELVLVEATNNIIIHAYEGKSGFDIKSNFEISESEVIITLVDNGKEFKYEEKQQNINTDEIKDLAEGNWGLDLITSITDKTIRRRENDANILTIKKSIDN